MIHVKDNFKAGEPIPGASWFNKVAAFINNMMGDRGIVVEKPEHPSESNPVTIGGGPIYDMAASAESTAASAADAAAAAGDKADAASTRADSAEAAAVAAQATADEALAKAESGTGKPTGYDNKHDMVGAADATKEIDVDPDLIAPSAAAADDTGVTEPKLMKPRLLWVPKISSANGRCIGAKPVVMMAAEPQGTVAEIPINSIVLADGGVPLQDGAGSVGTPGNLTAANADHRHPANVGGTVPGADSGSGSAGGSTVCARADHVHPLNVSDADPAAIGTDASPGTSSAYARADHVHAFTPVANSSNTGVGTSVTEGSDAAMTGGWSAGGSTGAIVRVVSRVLYNDAASSPSLVAFCRDFKYNSNGQLVSISGETRYVIDTPTLITWS